MGETRQRGAAWVVTRRRRCLLTEMDTHPTAREGIARVPHPSLPLLFQFPSISSLVRRLVLLKRKNPPLLPLCQEMAPENDKNGYVCYENDKNGL